MEIIELDRSYKGYQLIFRYSTAHYYALSFTRSTGLCSVTLEREAFPEPVEKSFETKLFPDYFADARVFAVREAGELIAFLEVSVEDWANRLRVNELLVEEAFRGLGIGRMLMEKAISIARENGNRALVLETQSCNDPAIQFYRSCGLELIGFDAIHYSNEDLEKNEVRLELGIRL